MYYLKGTIINILNAFLNRFNTTAQSYAANMKLNSHEYDQESHSSIIDFYTEKYLAEYKVANRKNSLIIDSLGKIDVSKLRENSYEAIVLKNILCYTKDYSSLISECQRLLKKGGKLYATVSTIPVNHERNKRIWGLTENSLRYILKKKFKNNSIVTKGYGNVLVGRFLLAGKNVDELSKKELSHYDPYFSIIVGVCATK